MSRKFTILFFVALIIAIPSINAQSQLQIEGILIDASGSTIPYAAVTVEGTSKGTSSNDEGGFYLSLPSSFQDKILVISSMGFETKQIAISEFSAGSIKRIELQETTNELDEVEVMSADDMVREALKRVKENTVSDAHLLKVLYRRASIEEGQPKFLVEQYLNVLDKGPSASGLKRVQVVEGRKSADYRLVKRRQIMHAVNYMAGHNPIRNGISVKSYKWRKIKDTSYDGEDVVVIEGKGDKGYRRLFVGLDSFKIYRIETSTSGAVFVYKKNEEGKLYLSYHSREWKRPRKKKLDDHTKKLLGPGAPDFIHVAYRQEAYVMEISTDKKDMNFPSYGDDGIDMGEVEVKYNAYFWKTISLPPDTAFFTNIKEGLEANFGVPLETQFKAVNN